MPTLNYVATTKWCHLLTDEEFKIFNKEKVLVSVTKTLTKNEVDRLLSPSTRWEDVKKEIYNVLDIKDWMDSDWNIL